MTDIATEQIETVIERLSTDTAFRTKYRENPDRCLETYLSPEEIRAIKTGDGHRLQAMGCDKQWDQLVATLYGTNPGP